MQTAGYNDETKVSTISLNWTQALGWHLIVVDKNGTERIVKVNSDTGWSQINSTYPTYLRVKNGFVTIVMRLTGGATPTDGQVLYTLPSAYRPSVELAVPSQNLRGSLLVKVNGEVSVNQNSGQTLNAYMAMVVTYPIES